MPTLADWLQWRRMCALALCEPDTQQRLHSFVHKRFTHYATACTHLTPFNRGEDFTPPPDRAWHAFETLLRIRGARTGKSYKRWLLQCGPDGEYRLDRVLAGASLLVRDTVREHMRHEVANRILVSIDAPLPGHSGTGLSLAELLPSDSDTRADVQRRDLNNLAAREAAKLATRLTRRQKIALVARELSETRAPRQALTTARCGRTMLANAHREALLAIANHVANCFPNDTKEERAGLAVALLASLKARLLSQAKNRWSGFRLHRATRRFA